MADYFEAIIQTAVMLAVDPLRIGIGDLQQLPGLVVALAALVQLDLYTHVQRVGAVEDGVGLVRVVVDRVAAPMTAVAIVAEDSVIILVVGILLADDPVALVAGVVIEEIPNAY